MKRRNWIFAPLALLLLPQAGHAQTVAEPLPVDPEVTVGTLPNGLRYYIRQNSRPEKRAELRLVVNAGSVLEDEQQLGLAHFVEHMAFNGTRNFAKQALVSYLESIGMRFGADLNAYTSFDETVYMLQVPTDSVQPMLTAMQILEDWAHGVSFDPMEIDKERGVVLEEWRLGQGAGERLRKQYFPTLFQNSRYADRLPIGTPEVLQNFDHAELTRYYRDWYRPDLMAVVAVGDFDKAAIEALIREHFGRIPAAASPRTREVFTVPGHTETLVAIATDREATSTVVEVDWKLPPRAQGTAEAFRQSLKQQLYSRMINARFSEITQKPNPPFIGAGSNYGGFIRSSDVYSLAASVQNGGVETGLEAILTEAERVLRHGFTATELARQKTNVLRGYERAFAERERTESNRFAAEYVRAFLEGEAIPGIGVEYQLAQQLLPGIGLSEVNALAGEWITDRNRVVIVTAPEREDTQLPTRQSLLAVFDRVRGKDIAPYDDVVADEPLIASRPAPGRIVSSAPVDGIENATRLELSNGAVVYLKPTTFKNDQIVMGAYSPGGLSLVDDADFMSGTFGAQLVALSGLGGHDAIQLQKVLTGKAASVQAFPGQYSEGMSGTASPPDIETMMQLMHLHFVAPRNDSSAYESFMSRIRAALANRDASPEAAFSDTFALTLWQHHPRAQPQNAAMLDMIDRQAAFRIFRDRFADAGDFTFVFVGAFDPAVMRPLIETYLASLPAAGRVEEPRDIGMVPARGVIEKTVRRGIEPKSQTRITFSGPFEYNRDNRLIIATLVDVMDMKLRDVLREDMGGTYGVGISQTTQRFPDGRYMLSIQFGAAPDRIEDLFAAALGEIEKMKVSGPDDEALVKVKEQQRRSYETSLQQNEYWRSVLLREAETGEPAAGALDFPQRLQAVTAEQIRDAARRYFDMSNFVRVTLMPETGG
ncbi:insulinase family protein [soil metagenome]